MSTLDAQPAVEDRPSKAVETVEVPYERPGTPWYSHRGAFYLLVFLLLLNVVATTSVTWGPLAMRAFQERMAARQAAKKQAQASAPAAAAQRVAIQRRQALYQQCERFAMPAGQVVYTEEPAEAERLLRGSGYSVIQQTSTEPSLPLPHPPVLWNGPGELTKVGGSLASVLPGGAPAGTVFLHERRAEGSGVSRVVWAHVSGSLGLQRVHGSERYEVTFQPSRFLSVYVLSPPAAAGGNSSVMWSYQMGILQPPSHQRVLAFAVDPKRTLPKREAPVVAQEGNTLRVLAGKVDGDDASHFTIDYTLNGTAGAIDVWLCADGRLRVEPREGSKTVERFDQSIGVEMWTPPVVPGR